MGVVKRDYDRLSVGGPSDDSGLPSVVAAAHELKAPLALIRQLSLMLEQEGVDGDEIHHILNQITLTSERALRLTNDLTKAARLQDAMFTLEPVNPKQLCEEVVHEMTPLFAAHGRKICLAKRSHQLLLIANRDLLHRILVNFSDNALNYAEESNMVEIYMKMLNRGSTVRLGVRDYGPAISLDAMKKLKNQLLAAPKAMSARPQSSGLGICISSHFAEAMNGQIGVTRHHDGATFYVDLQASSQLSLL